MSTAMSTTLIDLNSDTVTKATDEMRKAMAEAVVGDDVDGNDPTTNEFEKCAAVVFGKEAALFVPSGTMGNLIALLVYCEERGSEVIVGDEAHIHYYEQGGMAQIGGIYHRTVKNKPNGTFDITELENKIRVIDDDHLSITKVICLENTHNRCGGVVLPMDYLKQVKEIAEKHGLFVHMDGARLANAAVKLKVPCHEITKYCDSVSVCMSKGLCSPVGSVLCGSKSFIKRARRYRKVLGGGMRQSGHLTAACLISLHRMMDRLKDDHLKARNFAMKINEIKSDLIKIDMESVQTNIVLVTFEKEKLKPEDVVTALSKSMVISKVLPVPIINIMLETEAIKQTSSMVYLGHMALETTMSTAISTTLIDLHSDTVTEATDEMRKAMAEAVVGVDVCGNDPTTNEFEKCAAVVFGKEAALFVPSGTMGNLIALLVYCEERGSEVIVGDEAHIHFYEQGGMAQIGGIYHRTVKNKPNGTFDIKELENKIRVIDDDHISITKVICLENTHNRCGGVVLPMDYLKQVKEIAEKHGLFVHMDGARLANAAVKLEVPCHEITKYCDSVSVCMSKGLCSPVGSVLCGSKSFIKRARRYRKVLGGGMRQTGHLTAACLISLHRMMDRLKDDHLKASNFAMTAKMKMSISLRVVILMCCRYCGAVRRHLEDTDVDRAIQLLEDGVRQVEVARRFANKSTQTLDLQKFQGKEQIPTQNALRKPSPREVEGGE
ncbi:putative low-specificity L-threonine aldolase 2 [Nymphon striatum]|nr:putative low-specificity L-threonine aldolase 2 [Nymphon striatum]